MSDGAQEVRFEPLPPSEVRGSPICLPQAATGITMPPASSRIREHGGPTSRSVPHPDAADVTDYVRRIEGSGQLMRTTTVLLYPWMPVKAASGYTQPTPSLLTCRRFNSAPQGRARHTPAEVAPITSTILVLA